MAGRPFMRALVKRIEAMPGGEEYVFDQLAEGRTVKDVAQEMGCSRRSLYMWRDRLGHQDRLKPKWEAAIRLSAEADLEASTAEFDRLDRIIGFDDDGHPERRIPAQTEVQLVTGRAKYRQWLAARKDPERFGDKSAAEVTINFGDLHLSALAAAKTLHSLAPPAHYAIAEVVDDDEA